MTFVMGQGGLNPATADIMDITASASGGFVLTGIIASGGLGGTLGTNEFRVSRGATGTGTARVPEVSNTRGVATGTSPKVTITVVGAETARIITWGYGESAVQMLLTRGWKTPNPRYPIYRDNSETLAVWNNSTSFFTYGLQFQEPDVQVPPRYNHRRGRRPGYGHFMDHSLVTPAGSGPASAVTSYGKPPFPQRSDWPDTVEANPLVILLTPTGPAPTPPAPVIISPRSTYF